MPSSSLGFRPTSGTVQPQIVRLKQIELSVQPPPHVVHSTVRIPNTIRRNALSVWSVLSIASVLSLFSFGSLCSIGSVLSVLSIGCTTSFLSLSSVHSSMSVFSNSCHMGFFKDCTKSHSTNTSFSITISEEAWDTMASCTKAEYNMDARPDRCEYQDAKCSYGQSVGLDCKVRRKGSSTWMELDAKPSFKVKFEDRLEFMSSPCSDEYCPPGMSTNVHRSKKVTLNNMIIHDGEVAAYNEFRKYTAAPNAKHVSVALYRGEDLVRDEVYAMVENVNDKDFMRKHFGDDYTLHEVDGNKAFFERDGGRLTQEDVPVVSLTHIPLALMEHDHILKYYACERLVGHWDGACTNPRGAFNHYIAYNGRTFFYVPWGLDQTYQACQYSWLSHPKPQCVPVQECFGNASCTERYATIASNVERKADARMGSCTVNVVLLILVVIGHLTVCGIVAFTAIHCATTALTNRQLPHTPAPMLRVHAVASTGSAQSPPSRRASAHSMP